MRTIEQLLSHLNSLDIKLWVEEDRLRLNAPKGAVTPELREELGARKEELIAFLQSANSASQSSISPIQPRAKDDVPHLSFSQQRLWFLDQFEPGNVAYNIPMAIRLKGTLNVTALHQALNEIVKRHEALRTSFPSVDGQPIQKIAAPAPLPFPTVDLQHIPTSERRAEAERLRLEEAVRPFDLTNGPVMRARLLRLDMGEHILLVSQHHIVTDGWSSVVFFDELEALYKAFVSNLPSPLPPLSLQYADFAAWQRQWLQGPVLNQQMTYWKKQLGGSLPVLDLPLDYPRPPRQTFRGREHIAIFPPALRDKLKALSQAEGGTLFMTLLGAFKILLARYSGQEDILVGTPVANRKRVELEALIGFFVNTLVLRTDVSGNPTVRQLIARIREVSLEAYAHQDVPFELLVEALQPERDPSRTAVFQTMFILQNTPITPLEMPGLDAKPVEDEGSTSKFDLTLIAWEQPPDVGIYPEGLGVSIEYNTDLFAPTTIARVMNHFQNLLEAMVADPDQPILEIPFISQPERAQLLVDWNATAADYPREQAIYQLFEDQVKRTPDSVAVVFGDDQITYENLNRRANQLAHHLRTLGVGPDVFVGIHMQRSVDMIVGLMGILKAGGAYVPLDPAFPKDRLSYMLSDSQAPVLLTQQELADQLEVQPGTRIVCIDADWSMIARESSENTGLSPKPENLAYVIYTSGSTGKPKGVQIEHQSVVNFLTSMRREPGMTQQDILLSVTTLSFDIAGLEIFLPLTTGARLELVSRETATDGTQLIAAMAKSGATIMQATPITWRMLIEAGWQGDPRLKILCGGEALPIDLAHQILERCASLWNMYGPTETTIWSTLLQIQPGAREISIGRPISNTQIYILDPHLQPVSLGVTGELYIGGDGLARGYLNRPELTAERFIPDPFSSKPGARIYKTGDLVRYSSDGLIHFVGRADNQIKIRGFRIELGEIEAVLAQHPSIREVVVIAREDIPGDKRLVAYPILQEGAAEPSASDLRSFARQSLPEYMLPSAFVFLQEYPLTPNKKIDRKALPAPDQSRPELEDQYVAPRDEIEEGISRIFASVLKVERAGIHDNFFELGGHSLLATQVMSRIRQELHVDLPLRALFDAPNPQQLAEIVVKKKTEADLQPIPALSRDTDTFALSSGQQRLWFLDQFEPNNIAYNIPMAFHLQGNLDLAALQRALDEIVRRHEVLRTTFTMVNGQPVQRISPPSPVPLHVIDLQGVSEQERDAEADRLRVEEIERPFDLAQGPIFRARLLQLKVDEYILLVSKHHIVSDGWSMGIFMDELQALYKAFAAGEPSPLPALPIQYADFAIWQKQWLQGPMLDQQVSYWKKQLGGSLPVLDLPLDHPRPPMQTFHGAVQSAVFPAALQNQLKALSQAEGGTLFMTLLAAFKILLARYSGQEDVLVGMPVANRKRVELEPLIGLFINTLVMRTDLSGNPTVRELIARVRNTALEAYANQDVPFELLVEALQPERDPSRTPFFQTMFILQNTPAESINLPGLTLLPLEEKGSTAKFDLTIYTWEQPAETDDSSAELGVVFEYNTDLFEPETIARMMNHFQTLLEAMVAEPDKPIFELPLLSEAERRQLLVEWNDTQANYPREQAVHQLLQEQAQRTPDSVAVICGEESVTYETLNRRANQLAHHLQSLGVGPEVFVGIYMQRSVEMIVALLAILKAGGAYVPLDPAFPRDRLAYMIEDCQAKVLLTQQTILADAPEHQAKVVCIDSDWPQIAAYSDQDPTSGVRQDNVAYILYTSGSTGRPKGVQIEHRSLVNFLVSMQKQPGLTAEDVLVSVTTLSFDIAGLEIYLPLLAGAKLVIAESQDVTDGARLLELLVNSKATMMQATPSTWQLLIANGWTNDTAIKVLCGGEAMPRELADALLERASEVWNMYGPTETTIWSTTHRVTPGSGSVSIGKPIANTQVYVLDAYRQPVPVGVSGEFYIGGDGLARGYLHRAELTAEKFVPDPFHPEADRRMYRTGDVARFRADGTIDFLGRADHQVKVRGFRIELGEIEAVLAQHPAIREAVVIVREDVPGDKRLVAYPILHEDATEPSASDLRSFGRQYLPEYMLPNSFAFLQEYPLTPNKKIDRKALPAPDHSRSESTNHYIAPQSEAERTIADAWKSILKLEKIGVQDNFFDLGGHSLLIMQVHTQLRDSFSTPLTIADMFRYPTIESLAKYVRNGNEQSGLAKLEQRAQQLKQRRQARREVSQ